MSVNFLTTPINHTSSAQVPTEYFSVWIGGGLLLLAILICAHYRWRWWVVVLAVTALAFARVLLAGL